MLLLDVQVEIDSAKEDLLNEWYYAHVPRLVSVPGYENGRRYASLTPGPRYLALYEIRDESDLPSLLGSDHALRHPLTLSEWARWDKDLVPHMSHCRTNLYRAKDNLCLPLLRQAPAIVMVRLDAKEGRADFDGTVGSAINTLVVAETEVLGARLLHAAKHPATEWLSTSPHLLLVVECAGARAACDIALGKGAGADFLSSLAGVASGKPQATAYHRIAEHWSQERVDSCKASAS